MSEASAAEDLIRELRTFANEIELYVGEVGHEHAMHRTDLAALAHVMDGLHSPSELRGALGLSAPATSAMLERLERAGHIERHRSTQDRRGVEVTVTDSARAVGSAMFSPLARHFAGVLAGLDTAELRRTASLLVDLNQALRAAREEVRGDR